MRQIKVGNYISVLRNVDEKKVAPNLPVSRYQHARVTQVNPTYVLCKVKGGGDIYAIRSNLKPHFWAED